MDDNRSRKESSSDQKRALLLGLGLDCDDNQKRVTVGKNFLLAGGSKPTHELMQERAIKFNEELDKRGKTMDEVCEKEFRDIAQGLDMHVPSGDGNTE